MNLQNNEQTELLREILKWTKFAGMNQVKSVLETELKADVDKLVYQKSDGTHGIVELAKLAVVSNATIDRMWDAWQRMGLGEKIPVRGGSRFQRSFDLEDFGINVPETKVENVKKSKEEIEGSE